MDIEIKKMETEEETRGKAYVHWRAWHEAYPGLVSQEYLDRLTLKKCEKISFDWPDIFWLQKTPAASSALSGMGTAVKRRLIPERFSPCISCQNTTGKALAGN